MGRCMVTPDPLINCLQFTTSCTSFAFGWDIVIHDERTPLSQPPRLLHIEFHAIWAIFRAVVIFFINVIVFPLVKAVPVEYWGWIHGERCIRHLILIVHPQKRKPTWLWARFGGVFCSTRIGILPAICSKLVIILISYRALHSTFRNPGWGALISHNPTSSISLRYLIPGFFGAIRSSRRRSRLVNTCGLPVLGCDVVFDVVLHCCNVFWMHRWVQFSASATSRVDAPASTCAIQYTRWASDNSSQRFEYAEISVPKTFILI